MANVTRYEFDGKGNNTNNFILNERHTITVKNGRDFHYFFPDYAPFFINDFKLYTKTQQGEKQYLVEGVDFIFAYRFIEAALGTGKPIYGAVQFINKQFSGDVYLDYRTIGGEWNISEQQMQKILAEWEHNPIVSTWEQVANIPYQFPPIEHVHSVEEDTTSYGTLVEAIRRLSNGTNNGSSVSDADLNRKIQEALGTVNNASVGLGNVRNLGIMPSTNGNDRSDNYYVTPKGVAAIIENMVTPRLTQHENRRDNPHGVTPEIIGTLPETTIRELLNGKLGVNDKAANTTLFDGKTPEEYRIWVLNNGTAKNTTRFNNLTYPELVEDMTQRLNALIATSNNEAASQTLPGQVAKLKSADTSRLDGKTPEEFANWLQNDRGLDARTLGGSTKDQIIREARDSVNASSLQGSTKEQIIQEAVQQSGRVNSSASTLNGKSANQIIQEAKRNVDAVTLNGQTAQQIIDAAAQRSTSANTLGGSTKEQIINAAKANADKVGGLTVQQIVERAKAESSRGVNAESLGGQTLEQILASAQNASTLGGESLSQIKSSVDTKIAEALTNLNRHHDSSTVDCNGVTNRESQGVHRVYATNARNTSQLNWPVVNAEGVLIVTQGRGNTTGSIFFNNLDKSIYYRTAHQAWSKITVTPEELTAVSNSVNNLMTAVNNTNTRLNNQQQEINNPQASVFTTDANKAGTHHIKGLTGSVAKGWPEDTNGGTLIVSPNGDTRNPSNNQLFISNNGKIYYRQGNGNWALAGGDTSNSLSRNDIVTNHNTADNNKVASAGALKSLKDDLTKTSNPIKVNSATRADSANTATTATNSTQLNGKTEAQLTTAIQAVVRGDTQLRNSILDYAKTDSNFTNAMANVIKDNGTLRTAMINAVKADAGTKTEMINAVKADRSFKTDILNAAKADNAFKQAMVDAMKAYLIGSNGKIKDEFIPPAKWAD